MATNQSVYRIVLMSAFVTCTGIAHAMAGISPAYRVTDLGSVGGTGSAGLGLNASGQVTGYSDTTQSPNHAFLWTPTTPNGTSGAMQDLGPTAFANSAGYAINNNGDVTGECCVGLGSDGTHASLYDGTTMHDLGTLGGTYSSGRGINAAGHVTGDSWTAGGTAAVIHAFLYNGTMHDLGSLGDYHSFGFGINDSGQVTGYSYTTVGGAHAFLWTPTTPNGTSGTMHDLGTLSGDPSQFSTGYGVNASGQVTGDSGITGGGISHAFLWTPTTPNGAGGTMLDLGTLGGFLSSGLGINAAGQITGWSLTTPDEFISHAFLYTSESGMVDLNTLIDPQSGWELFDGNAINDAGQITGSGQIGGESHAFLLTPVPEPASAVLFALAALSLVLTFARRERRRAVPQCTLAAMSIVLLASAGPANAAMFNASTVDELITAINSANQNAEPDSIALAAGTTFTLTLANTSTNGPSGLPIISASESLSIFGYGSIIERSPAIETPGFRLFDVAAGASLSLQDLTLQRGRAFGRDFAALGGAILNQGTLALQNVVIQNNNAVGRGSSGNQFSGPQPADSGMGGGIFSSGSLTIEGGAIQDNLAQGGNGAQSISAFGGGTFPSLSGAAGMGGGLYIGAGFAHLRNVTVVNNTAQGGRGGNGHATHGPYGGADGGGGYGGGLYVAEGVVNLTDVTLSSNFVSGGAGGNGGNGAFTGNGGDGGQAFGGALRFAEGTVAVRNSAVMDNAAQGGAAGVKGSSSGSINGNPGPGQGGGIQINMAQVGLDEFTQDHVTSNAASTSHPNIYGPYDFLPNQIPGDYNEEGTVDAADYTVWRDGLGSVYALADYDVWKSNFGQSLGAGSSAVDPLLRVPASAALLSPAIPEPTSLALAIGGLLGLFAIAPRHRQDVQNSPPNFGHLAPNPGKIASFPDA